jgi:hypothetical protein
MDVPFFQSSVLPEMERVMSCSLAFRTSTLGYCHSLKQATAHGEVANELKGDAN